MSSYGRLSTNLVANVANFLVNILVGIFFTPYLIRHLGVAAYGVIPLATTVTSYMAVVTLALNAAVGRFITVAFEQNKPEEANRIFNTAFWGSLLLVLLLSAPGALLVLYSDHLFRLPVGYEAQTKVLLLCSIGMFMLTVIANPFEVATYCKNRFDIRNSITITATLLRVGTVIVLFSFLPARISFVGAALFASALFSFTASVSIWRKLTPHLDINRHLFSIGSLRQLTGTGGWIALNQVGTILLLSIDLLVVNRLFGPEQSGQYATLLQWSALLRGLAGAAAAVFGPTTVYFYARNDIDGLVRCSRQAVKFMGLFIALPVGLISGLARPLLHVWVGPDFSHLAPLLTLMTVHLCVNLGYLPLHNVSAATNNVRLPGILQIFLGIANLALALLLARQLGWGIYGVAAAGAIVITAKNIIFTPLYSAKILDKEYGVFMKELVPIGIVTLVLSAASWTASSFVDLASWGRLVAFGGAATIIYGIVVWHILMNEDERKLAINNIPFIAKVEMNRP